ncbi:cation channel family protein (macronuclear) [Tetrahymena thermophila SB210]|uniref:Cation channel family protein n=1 Tax=Tetrahymena thermophila (strain SB210) TaxID=312017 RepID=I7MGU7_TETTS|nr:cation channel family protein [Tetrahymena thermophila SB210]EAR85478.2 cation channel family protein [Tetrahymena thermophila SB210]|eukprot:XP_001033141.2 cation channel family protein [Tetrahymena thermophila SB210]
MSFQISAFQMANDESKIESSTQKNISNIFSGQNSILNGGDITEDLRLGQNKRQNLFLDELNSFKMSQVNNQRQLDDENIEFDEEYQFEDQKMKMAQLKQISSFFNSTELYKHSDKSPSQNEVQIDNSQLSPRRKSIVSEKNQKKHDYIQSPTKDMQKSHPSSSSSNSQSSSDTDKNNDNSPSNQQKKFGNKRRQDQSRNEYRSKSAKRIDKDGGNSVIFRKKKGENSSRFNDREGSISRYFDPLKKNKTSMFMYDDQSVNNISAQMQNLSTNKQNLKRRMSSRRQLNHKAVWNMKAFSIIMFINKLIFSLKRALIFTRPHLLTTLQLNLINDKSARDVGEGWGTRDDKLQKIIEKGVQQNEFFGKFTKRYKIIRKAFKKKCKILTQLHVNIENLAKKINKKIPLFDPMSLWMSIWEILIFLVTCFNFVYIPFDYSFDMTNSALNDLYFHKISPIIYFSDIVIRFNTSYFHRGYLVQERQKIVKNYLLNLFLIDLITTFSLSSDFFNFSGSRLIFFARIFYFSKILDKMMEQIMLNSKLAAIVSLILLFAEVQFVVHIFTCAFHSLGQYELSIGNLSWLSVKQNLNSPFSQYINGFYFCTITMTTIGFGDITPQNDTEKLFVSFMSMFASGIFGYTLNFIGSILMDFKKQKEQFQQKLAEVNHYMTKHSVQSHLQSKTRKYLEYIHSEGVDKQNQPEKSLDHLSKFLREEILKDVYLKSIKSIQLFENKFCQAFKERLALRMKEQIYGPDEIIVKKGNYEIPRIYIIMKGEIELYWEVGSNKQIQSKDNEKKLKYLKEGSSFGFYEFFTQNYQSFFSAQSKGVSLIQYIQLDDFLDLLQDFENEKEIYCFVKDSVLMKKEYKMIQAPCYSCSRYDHLISECPLLFYDSNKDKIIKAYNKHFIEERKNFSRPLKRIKYQTLINCVQQTSDVCNFRDKVVFKTETDYSDSDDDDDDDYYSDEDEENEEIKDLEKKERNDDLESPARVKQLTVIESSNNDSDEESKKSKRKQPRSQTLNTAAIQLQAANSPGLANQAIINSRRGSQLGEDILRQAQQRRSLLIQGIDDKMPSMHSISRLPSIGSKANRQSFIGTQRKGTFIGSNYDNLGTINETELTGETKKAIKAQDVNQNLIKEQLYINYQLQQHQLQNQQKNENFIEDRVCQYEIYFPHNNLKNIIEEMERIKRKWRSKSIQRQRRTGLKDKLITLKQLHTLKTVFADKYDIDTNQNSPQN